MRKFTVWEFNELFPTEDACLDFLKDSLYPDGVTCRKCGKITKHHRLTSRRAYSCQECGTHVYPLAGTIYAKSRTPLKSWFYAMYLMSSTRCGISAKQLERELGVTYKTAWRMFHQLRTLLSQSDTILGGVVEMDEAYIGGKRKWRQGRPTGRHTSPRDNKTAVFGIAQRGHAGHHGRVVAMVVPDASERSLLPHVKTKVLPKSTVYTDEWIAYRGLKHEGFTHSRVAHSQKIYVSGDVHTNTIEGFWSLVKRGIGGVYHSVSSKHLQAYLDEYAFRYNNRDDSDAMFDVVGSRVPSTRYGQFGKYHPIGE
jgi:transposase